MRLNRFLARAGVASRRKCDDLVFSGQVAINGLTVTEPGRPVLPGQDRVVASGRPVVLPAVCEYFLLNKMRGYLVTASDPQGRSTIFDRLQGMRPGIVAVGRLDRDTAGALLLTDDGELIHRLLHPRYKVVKHYEALVEGKPDATALAALQNGLELDDGPTAPATARVLRSTSAGTFVSLHLHEGRKRQVRRMFDAIGHPVRRLKRTQFAGLPLGDLHPGQWRRLTDGEIRHLKRLTGLA